MVIVIYCNYYHCRFQMVIVVCKFEINKYQYGICNKWNIISLYIHMESTNINRCGFGSPFSQNGSRQFGKGWFVVSNWMSLDSN